MKWLGQHKSRVPAPPPVAQTGFLLDDLHPSLRQHLDLIDLLDRQQKWIIDLQGRIEDLEARLAAMEDDRR